MRQTKIYFDTKCERTGQLGVLDIDCVCSYGKDSIVYIGYTL